MKKLLALAMVLAMVLSFGVVAFAAEQDQYVKGTEPTINEETGEVTVTPVAGVGNAQNSGSGSNNKFDQSTKSGNTEFYLNIRDAKGKDPEIEQRDVVTDASGNKITINYKETTNTQLSVTVPLYVSMWAFNQGGQVITPDSKAYAIKNESKYDRKTEVTNILKYWKTAGSIRELLRDDAALKDQAPSVYELADGQTSIVDKYAKDALFLNALAASEKLENGVITKVETVAGKSLDALAQWADEGNGYVYYVDSTGTMQHTSNTTSFNGVPFAPGGELKAYKGFINEQADAGVWTAAAVADDLTKAGIQTNGFSAGTGSAYPGMTEVKGGGLDVQVVKLATTKMTGWTMVAAGGDLQAKGRMTMSIKSVDMAGVSASGLDITDRDWTIDSGKQLELPITAAIGDNVNGKTDDTPVLTVTYTIKPDFESSTTEVTGT